MFPSFRPCLLALCLLVAGRSVAAEAEVAEKPAGHEARQMEGWTVRVDRRLLAEQAAVGERALKLLGVRLYEISLVVPEPALTSLRQMPIQLDFSHGALTAMQYHPSVDWLREHGYQETLAKCVHIPVAASFSSAFEIRRQPWAVLHELAHAYHDQVLGFEEPRIRAAWERFRASGKYQATLNFAGRSVPHYALTDHKEFFAEMTECYFGTNDFYPFVAGELKQAEPEIFALLEEVWGALPVRCALRTFPSAPLPAQFPLPAGMLDRGERHRLTTSLPE